MVPFGGGAPIQRFECLLKIPTTRPSLYMSSKNKHKLQKLKQVSWKGNSTVFIVFGMLFQLFD